jgi:hypothetical protein
MWIYASQPPAKDAVRRIINLHNFDTISVTNERAEWVVIASQGNPMNTSGEYVTLAKVSTQEQAIAIQGRIFRALASGKTGIDLEQPEDGRAEPPVENSEASSETDISDYEKSEGVYQDGHNQNPPITGVDDRPEPEDREE